MKIGYARVSTEDQNLDLQLSALQHEGCEIIFREKSQAAPVAVPSCARRYGAKRATP